MEAFFGVELYKKFEDVLGDLENIELDLKDISKEVGRLGGKLEDEDRPWYRTRDAGRNL